MNGTSFLLLIVFLVIGYVIHPMALPKLNEQGFGPTAIKEQIDANGEKIKIDKPSAKKPTKKVAETKVAETNPRITDEATEPEMNNTNKVAKPAVKPAPRVEEVPLPTAAPIPGLSDLQVLNAMRHSIRSGELKEFTFAQVKEWKRTKDEMIAGQNYDVGKATYTADTLFGKENFVAKALFKDGQLVKWVWDSNNFEMK